MAMYTRDYSWAAGGFYPTGESACRTALERHLSRDLPEIEINEPVAGIFPHAGWVFSGPTAGLVFKALGACTSPKTIISFGAVHVPGVRKASAIAEGRWKTPLGDIEIDSGLAAKILDGCKGIVVENPGAHADEHSLEVAMPFVKMVFPDAKLLPIMVPPDELAATVGSQIGEIISPDKKDILVIGSTDMTHYGERFGFTPAGKGPDSVKWVKEVNDRGLIDIILKMDAESVVAETSKNHSACGGGAIAATVAAAKAMGAQKAQLLEHTTSYDVSPDKDHSIFVGYTGFIM